MSFSSQADGRALFIGMGAHAPFISSSHFSAAPMHYGIADHHQPESNAFLYAQSIVVCHMCKVKRLVSRKIQIISALRRKCHTRKAGKNARHKDRRTSLSLPPFYTNYGPIPMYQGETGDNSPDSSIISNVAKPDIVEPPQSNFNDLISTYMIIQSMCTTSKTVRQFTCPPLCFLLLDSPATHHRFSH